MKCTFFGHRDTPQEIETRLRETVVQLIERHGADTFYVGNQGEFDSMVGKVLQELQGIYPHIACFTVLSYMPGTVGAFAADGMESIYPEGLETAPKRFAISKRNRWLVEHSDTVIAYVKHSTGGAAQWKTLAEKKGKWVINLAK